MDQVRAGQPSALSGADAAQCGQATYPNFVKAYGHNGYFTSLKAIVHFYNTRDALPRCQPKDPGEGTTCWPAPESTDNINTKRVGRLGLSDAEEDALVSFMQTLTDGFMSRDQQ
jgi:cytochrome c peroxidase